jgi:hypothetical protein
MVDVDDDDTFARFDVDDNGDLWVWFDQPVQRFRIRRDQAEHLYAMLDAEFRKPSLSLGDPVISPDDIRVGKSYLAVVEPNGPLTPGDQVTMLISHSIDTNVLIEWLHENPPFNH